MIRYCAEQCISITAPAGNTCTTGEAMVAASAKQCISSELPAVLHRLQGNELQHRQITESHAKQHIVGRHAKQFELACPVLRQSFRVNSCPTGTVFV